MAICVRPRQVLATEVGRGPVASGTEPAAATDDEAADEGAAVSPADEGAAVSSVTGSAAATDDKTADEGGKAVAPQARYLIITGAVIVAGGFAGTLIHDHWARAVSFAPPQGIGIFALFYIIAQVIERVQEPFVPYLGLAKDPGEEKREKQEKKLAKEKKEAEPAKF
jgi:hypothetical protein